MDRDLTAKVRTVAPPAESLLCGLYASATLADSYAMTLPGGATRDPERLGRAVFGVFPGWVRALMGLRDTIMAPFGVKTSGQMRARGGVDAERINFFRILERHPTELILGEDDRHLDFRASLLVRRGVAGDEVVTTTVVHCHNWLGRCYLAVILPFHITIVRASLRDAARRGWPPAAT
jgi:hypothetical protein